jgi:hypothetical protein
VFVFASGSAMALTGDEEEGHGVIDCIGWHADVLGEVDSLCWSVTTIRHATLPGDPTRLTAALPTLERSMPFMR